MEIPGILVFELKSNGARKTQERFSSPACDKACLASRFVPRIAIRRTI